jgi:hypothetical protein
MAVHRPSLFNDSASVRYRETPLKKYRLSRSSSHRRPPKLDSERRPGTPAIVKGPWLG